MYGRGRSRRIKKKNVGEEEERLGWRKIEEEEERKEGRRGGGEENCGWEGGREGKRGGGGRKLKNGEEEMAERKGIAVLKMEREEGKRERKE